jgi:hypothetical protein
MEIMIDPAANKSPPRSVTVPARTRARAARPPLGSCRHSGPDGDHAQHQHSHADVDEKNGSVQQAVTTVAAFAARLKDSADLDSVRDDLASVAQTALEPAHVWVWTSPRDLAGRVAVDPNHLSASRSNRVTGQHCGTSTLS